MRDGVREDRAGARARAPPATSRALTGWQALPSHSLSQRLPSLIFPTPPSLPMPLLRLRVTGSEDDVRAIGNLLTSLDGIEHVEEVGDLMPHMDDFDSSSAGLSDTSGPDMHEIEIDAPNPSTAQKVREAVEALAFELDVLVEFEEEEG